MDKKVLNNLKNIYGVDLIVFAIVLSLHLFVDGFNFNGFWSLFIVLPSLVDVVLNKGNIFNLSLFIISSSVFGYFIFDTAWACLIVFVALIGLLMLFGKQIMRKNKVEEDASK